MKKDRELLRLKHKKRERQLRKLGYEEISLEKRKENLRINLFLLEFMKFS